MIALAIAKACSNSNMREEAVGTKEAAYEVARVVAFESCKVMNVTKA